VGQSIIKAKRKDLRTASFLLVFVLGSLGPLRAEQTQLALVLGTQRTTLSDASMSDLALRSDLLLSQGFFSDLLYLDAELQGLSLLSDARAWGYLLRARPTLGMGVRLSGGPHVALEKAVGDKVFNFLVGAHLNFDLWSLRFETLFDLGLRTEELGRRLRYQQNVLFPMGEGMGRRDFIGLYAEWNEFMDSERVGAARRAQTAVMGLVFKTDVEKFLF
jgi:hypothetical protein